MKSPRDCKVGETGWVLAWTDGAKNLHQKWFAEESDARTFAVGLFRQTPKPFLAVDMVQSVLTEHDGDRLWIPVDHRIHHYDPNGWRVSNNAQCSQPAHTTL